VVSGRVADAQTLEGVGGATIVLAHLESPDKEAKSIFTDDDGAYVMTGVPFGDYRLMIFIDNLSAQYDRVHVAAPSVVVKTAMLDHDRLPRDLHWDPKTARDCTVPAMIDEQRHGAALTSCGSIGESPKPGESDRAVSCIVDAISNQRPFRFDQDLQGIDALVQHGYAGSVRDGRYLVMRIEYTSDVHGGGSAWSGSANVDQCAALTLRLPRSRRCSSDVSSCFECASPIAIERCHRGPDSDAP
jgi:hypothetical protein